jgi:hypothetical protein
VGNLEAGKILKLAEELISKSQKVHDSVAAVPLEKVSSKLELKSDQSEYLLVVHLC